MREGHSSFCTIASANATEFSEQHHYSYFGQISSGSLKVLLFSAFYIHACSFIGIALDRPNPIIIPKAKILILIDQMNLTK